MLCVLMMLVKFGFGGMVVMVVLVIVCRKMNLC